MTQSLIASYYMCLASLLTDVLDPVMVVKYMRLEYESMTEDDDLREWMVTTSMAEQAKSFKSKHIGGLTRINNLIVEP